MVLYTGNGEVVHTDRYCGFTLVELLLVLFVVALLASLVAPMATRSVEQTREATLKEDLQVVRKAIDDYYTDTGAYPESLGLLVEKHYLRKLPRDPLTESTTTWVEVRSEDLNGGIIDIRSGADGKASDGVAYRDW
ncbi:MAG: prepilin-type N-terminal cleavage/methylation domain-containing protein [Gammaproteobacteria bacterium]|nr:prepilin-type N-terminal cleavage/methylation domain-containing protein [Gammaproteobacteria bacterium]